MGSNPTLSVFFGEVTEWLKVHDWKSCVLKDTAGSNPALSVFDRIQFVVRVGDGRVLRLDGHEPARTER